MAVVAKHLRPSEVLDVELLEHLGACRLSANSLCGNRLSGNSPSEVLDVQLLEHLGACRLSGNSLSGNRLSGNSPSEVLDVQLLEHLGACATRWSIKRAEEGSRRAVRKCSHNRLSKRRLASLISPSIVMPTPTAMENQQRARITL